MSTNYSSLLFERRGRVAWITLNRPEAMNAVNPAMVEELQLALAEVRSDATLRVLVLTGAGRAFCAGVDLKELLGALEPGAGGAEFSHSVQAMLSALRHLPKPVIAAVNGLAVAGGLELAMCCDLAIGAASAQLGDGHSNYGVFPGGGGTAVLPRRIGLARAKQLLFTGDTVAAEQMKAWGLLNEVVPDGQLQTAVSALAEKMAAKSGQLLRRMKEVADKSLDQSQEAALVHEMDECRAHTQSVAFREGLAAFREKRQPVFAD